MNGDPFTRALNMAQSDDSDVAILQELLKKELFKLIRMLRYEKWIAEVFASFGVGEVSIPIWARKVHPAFRTPENQPIMLASSVVVESFSTIMDTLIVYNFVLESIHVRVRIEEENELYVVEGTVRRRNVSHSPFAVNQFMVEIAVGHEVPGLVRVSYTVTDETAR